jgi:hypothetical protein
MKKLFASAALAAFLLLPGIPAGASEPSAPVRVTACPPGYTGYVVWHWNEKRGWYEVASYCIPWGP